ncbi:MAG: adenylyltransferase/cytidyltransferase family protein [Bacteroidales bacterium]|nr:adenylyltransferase/cytidyltransferase family protein [Bacteroidales bacterium]
MKTVLTVGVFDLLHIGHVELFRKAKALGDRLVVAVQDSDYILKYKPGAKTVGSTEERAYMVKALKYVDDIVIYTDVEKITGEVEFDIFAAGPDQNHEGFRKVFDWCRANGRQVVILPRTEGISTTQLKENIKAL